MPSRRGLGQIIAISQHSKLIIMVSLGMARNMMDWLSFTWDGNVQEIWNLPGPEPSFSVNYHLDYWTKSILSLVVLFRNYTTPLHVLFYIVMMYPLMTGERPRLLLPWLYLQMVKNIVMDVISTAAGVLLCWLRHSSGLMVLEFLVVQIISMMPSIYLRRYIRSYYFDLYYAELDGEHSIPSTKASRGITLAERRRATKSLDGRMPMIVSSDHRSRINSCLTYDEFFGPENWEGGIEDQVSKSLTTLLTVESQESDDVGEDDRSLEIIDDENLTPAEKTLKILGLTREDVDATALLLQKKTSTTDLEGCKSEMASNLNFFLEPKSSIVYSTPETGKPSSVGVQVRFANELNTASDLEKDEEIQDSGECACCQETKCSRDGDVDSDEAEIVSTDTIRNAEVSSREGSPLDCCDRSRERNEKHRESQRDTPKTCDDDVGNADTGVPPASMYNKKGLCSSSRLRAVVERDGIAWENLKEINFVSVIDKALCGEIKPFTLQRDIEDLDKNFRPSLKCDLEDSGKNSEVHGNRDVKRIIPEREDGTRFVHRIQESSNIDPACLSAPSSASFGVESDILALSTSHVFDNMRASGTRSFDSTATMTKQLTRPDDDTTISSCFKSSFQRHSKMFHDATAQLESLFQFRSRMHLSSHRAIGGANEYSPSYQRENEDSTKACTDERSYSLGFHRSRISTPQYQRRDYDAWDSELGNFSGNEVDLDRDIRKCTKSKVSENLYTQIISDIEKDLPSSPKSLVEKTSGPTRVAQTSSMISKAVFEADRISGPRNVAEGLQLKPEAITQTEEQGNSTATFISIDDSVAERKSSTSKNSRKNVSKRQKSLASSSKILRSSKNRETTEDREAQEMQALRYYNEKTLLKYKREMDARDRKERDRHAPENSLGRRSAAGIRGTNFNHASYAPSVPEFEKPEKELIFNIENGYARFTRSKPVDSVKSQALHGNILATEVFDIYNGNGRMKKDLRKMKVGGKSGMRKQHSKYSKCYNGVTNDEPDVTSMSGKKIEGLQKGRDLGRTLGKKNIRAADVEEYFLERQIDGDPLTGQHLPIITIKSFLSNNRSDPSLSVVSSGYLAPEDTGSPFIEVLNSPEEIPYRIEHSEYYRQLRNNHVLRNIKETVENIDWSFQRPNSIGICHRPQEKQAVNVGAEIVRLERPDIVHKTTENILQSIFANSDNSERGFHLGETGQEFYPIFNTVAITMKEIIRAAALRGYTDEFISQPATEIEEPEIVDGNSHGLTNSAYETGRGSSSRYLRCNILSKDLGTVEKRCENDESLSITTFAAADLCQKEREAFRREIDPLNQDEQNEKEFSRSSQPISSTDFESVDINLSAIGAENLPAEVTSQDGRNSEIWRLEDYSSFLCKGSATPKKSLFSSRCDDPEHSLQIGQKSERMNSEQVGLSLQNFIRQCPGQEITNREELQLKFEVSTCRGVLNFLNAGGRELQSIVLDFLDQFPDCEVTPRNSRGSKIITGLQKHADLYSIETKLGAIMKGTGYRGVSEELVSTGSGNLSLQQNDRSEGAMTQPGASHTKNFATMTITALLGSRDHWRKEDHRWKGENYSDSGVAMEVDNKQHIKAASSERINKPRHEDEKLLPNIVKADSVSLTHSEMLNRSNFRREVISSAFVTAVNQDRSSHDVTKTIETEILAPNGEKNEPKYESVNPDYAGVDKFTSRNFMNVEPEADMLELRTTNDDEEVKSRRSLGYLIENTFLLDADNATSDLVPIDIENAECAIDRMKSIFEQFSLQDQRRREKSSEYTFDNMGKVSPLTNLRFLVDGELRKLENLVQKVSNYVAITSRSSAQSINPSNEAADSDEGRKELNDACRNGSSDNRQNVPEILSKNGVISTTDDSQGAQVSLPETRGFRKNSERATITRKIEVDQFSSWDKVIPSPAKPLISRKNERSKRKKKVPTREPRRRVVKVVKLIEEKNVDFFSARSVPQRGRGLSSGYLMDSDSDGNFTASHPATPGSVESETSQTSPCDNEQPAVFTNPLKAFDIFSLSGESCSGAYNRPVETCWSSSSENPVTGTFSSAKATDSGHKLIEKDTNDDFESRQTQESPKVSGSSSPLLVSTDIPATAESATTAIMRGDKNTENASCDKKSSAFGVESLSTEVDLQYMKSVDTARIENKLKDVVQQILNRRVTGIDHPATGPRIGSKNVSTTSISHAAWTESSTNLQSNNYNLDDAAAEQEEVKTDHNKRIQQSLPKGNNTSIEQLNFDRKGIILKLPSSHSVAVPCASSPRESGVSVRNVATGTEYNTEVFKDLLDMFEKIQSMENAKTTRQPSKRSDIKEVENGKNEQPMIESNSQAKMHSTDPSFDVSDGIRLKTSSNLLPLDSPLGLILSKNSSATDELPIKNVSSFLFGHMKSAEKLDARKFATSSYDSFGSVYSYKAAISAPSCQAMSISDHTFFEEFPEQVRIGSQLSSNSCAAAGGVSSESIQFKSQEGADENKGSEKERSLTNVGQISNHVAAAVSPGGGRTDGRLKKNSTSQKTGIPRPVKDKKERE